MILNKFSYIEFESKPNEWKFEECTLGKVNLIVGKNATGKSRTLALLRSLAGLIATFDVLPFEEGKYQVEFSNGKERIFYKIEYHNKVVIQEELSIDNELKLRRIEDGSGEIYSSEFDRLIKFQIQTDKLTLVAKRDSIQHPFIEDLVLWAKGTTLFEFGSPLGKDQLVVRVKDYNNQEPKEKLNIQDTVKVNNIFLAGEKEFGQRYKDLITTDMKHIGFGIDEVGIDIVEGITFNNAFPGVLPTPVSGIFLKEHDLHTRIYQHNISQGMFRALSLFIQINYGLLSNISTCILVDDIGEGLDFERSTSLIKRLVEITKDTNIQLIMSTNDRFVMNTVPLEYWLILNRNGGNVENLNYRNSKDMFDDFLDTGLNNFDLFSSGYYKRGK